jgi:hypothetical protein
LAAALIGGQEDERETYRVAIFPTFIRYGGKAKGQTWEQYLRDLKLGYPDRKKVERGKPDMTNVYELADRIRKLDQRAR